MKDLFSYDGIVYKVCSIIFYISVLNFLWIIFSLPLITIGASTTSLYYVIGKIIRNENPNVFKDFFRSFKLNFKQSTIVWVIIVLGFFILYINFLNTHVFGSLWKPVRIIQMIAAYELSIVIIYSFPMMSRYNCDIKNLLKTSLIIGNINILTSLLCVGLFLLSGLLLFKIPGLFTFIFISFYAMGSSVLIQRALLKHYIQKQGQGIKLLENN